MKEKGKYSVGDGKQWHYKTKSAISSEPVVVELLAKQVLDNDIWYFVRVLGHDRRHDRWVLEDTIQKCPQNASCPSPSITLSQEGNTRSLKRARLSQGEPSLASVTNVGPGHQQVPPVSSDPLACYSLYEHSAVPEYNPSQDKRRDVKWARRIVFGNEIIDVWYPSPHPRASIIEEVTANGGTLYVDDLSLRYTGSAARALEHRQSPRRHGLRGPPGSCLYDDGKWALWEIEGGEGAEFNTEVAGNTANTSVTHARVLETAHRELYCQNIGLLSKMFLDSKQECFTTSNFTYYVFTEKIVLENSEVTGSPYDSLTLRPADGGVDYAFRGYFSREKNQHDNNLSCIMVLPPWQRLGLGQMLVHLSYLISGREPRKKRNLGAGSPERPLSIPGKYVYLSYWKERVAKLLLEWEQVNIRPTIADIITHSHIEQRDVLKALHAMGLLITSGGSETLDLSYGRDDLLKFIKKKATPEINEKALNHIGLHFGQSDDDEGVQV